MTKAIKPSQGKNWQQAIFPILHFFIFISPPPKNPTFGDSMEVFIDLQKNDYSYGIPHGTLNKNSHQIISPIPLEQQEIIRTHKSMREHNNNEA